MARVTRSQPRGDLADYVPAAEARKIAAGIRRCRSVGGLVRWSERYGFDPEVPVVLALHAVRARAFPDTAREKLDAEDAEVVALTAIEDLAVARRYRPTQPVGCPACGEVLPRPVYFYCDEHREQGAADVRRLLGR